MKEEKKLALQELKLQSFETDLNDQDAKTIMAGSVPVGQTNNPADCVVSLASASFATKAVSVSFVASAGSIVIESVVTMASAVSTVVSVSVSAWNLGQWIGSNLFPTGCPGGGGGTVGTTGCGPCGVATEFVTGVCCDPE